MNLDIKERLSLGVRQVKKWPSPILKFYSNFESPIQSEYAGKFSVQSDDWNCFYWTRKVDDGFFGKKASSRNCFSNFTKSYLFDLKECIRKGSSQDFEWFEVESMCTRVLYVINRTCFLKVWNLLVNFGYFWQCCNSLTYFI